MRTGLRVALALATITLPALATAQEFRRIQPIPGSVRNGAGERAFRPVDLRLIERALDELERVWNTEELRRVLDPDFYDRERVLDQIDRTVPRDARLRILAIESVRTDEQTVEPVPGQGFVRVSSRVTAFVRTQVEFNDPIEGYQRNEGASEYVFQVIEVVRP